MQLAATPRPHPPPVPPRPSRQVVAEALKRSPRPPCPTRQAPPPPDTKPWRAKKDKENGPPHRGYPGRTVVYDSVGKPTNGGDGAPVEAHNNHQRTTAAGVTGEEDDKKNAESVRKDDDHNEQHQHQHQHQRQNPSPTRQLTAAAGPRTPSERNERNNNLANSNSNININNNNNNKNSSNLNTCNNGGAAIPQRLINKPAPPLLPPVIQRPTPAERHHQQISHSNLRVHQLRSTAGPPTAAAADSYSSSVSPVPQTTSIESKFPPTPPARPTSPPKLINQRNIQVINGAVVFEAHNAAVVKPSAAPRPVENIVENISAKSLKESETIINEDKDSPGSLTTHDSEQKSADGNNSETRINEPSDNTAEDNSEKSKNKDSSPLSNNTNISSDDCATVVQVVVEDTERRVAFDESVNIQHEDWLEAGVRYSSTKITLSGDEIPEETLEPTEELVNGFHSPEEDEELISTFDFASIKEKIAMSSLQGLPPLPRSLSGFNLNAPSREGNEPPPPPARSSSRPQRGTRPTQPTGRPPPPPQGRQLTTLDTQLAKLRREMFGLRQLDLSLLSQLWSLNESIQEFRQLLQEQDDRAPSPSPSSEEGDDTSYGSHPPPPPPHLRRPPPVTHHHRAPRPPPRNDSPSSEEYGAV